jgi:hypothetical protein
MISTLHKFPWHMSQYITLDNRKRLYDTTVVCIRTLIAFLYQKARFKILDQPQMTTELVAELVVVALGCPGFSEQQKASLVQVLNNMGRSDLTTGRVSGIFPGGSGSYSAKWPFLALSPKAAVSDEFLKVRCTHLYLSLSWLTPWQFYAALIRQAIGTRAVDVDLKRYPFGKLSIAYGRGGLSSRSIAEVAKIERDTVALVLTPYLTNGQPFKRKV